MKYHPTHPHQFVALVLEFINWGMFLAVWIALAEQISCNTSFCAAPGGGHLHTKQCKTIYSACALAIVSWILFTISFCIVAYQFACRNDAGKVQGKGGSTRCGVTPSDKSTLPGESA